MKESSVRYVCRECGHVENKWNGRCPECGSWNSFDEEKTAPVQKGRIEPQPVMNASLQKLSDVPYEAAMRVSSGIEELDRVLGGGVMRPSSVLVGGEPGIGKSTIMLQMLSALSENGNVLYVSGEETEDQVKLRCDRLGIDSERLSLLHETDLDSVLHYVYQHVVPNSIL